MASTIKLLGPEANLGTATALANAKVVRVLNNKTSIQIITHTDKDGQVLGTVTLAAGEVVYIQKASTDKLLGAATSLAVSVAYTN